MDPILLNDVPEPLPEFSIARVEQAITPTHRGRVAWKGTSWFAQFYDPDCEESVRPGKFVIVLAIRSNTLLVLPEGHAALNARRRDRNQEQSTTPIRTGVLHVLMTTLTRWF